MDRQGSLLFVSLVDISEINDLKETAAFLPMFHGSLEYSSFRKVVKVFFSNVQTFTSE